MDFLGQLFMLSWLPDLGHDASFWVLLGFGALTSFHCLGMCGGLALAQTVKRVEAAATPSRGRFNLASPLAYNLGRVIAYTLVGALAGTVGRAIGLPPFLKGLVPILGGLFMVIMGINLFGKVPLLRRFNLNLPKGIARRLHDGRRRGPLVVGLLSAFMPCGPLQIVQLYALGTGSTLGGASALFFFSLGTVPMLFAAGMLGNLLSARHARLITKASAVLVVALGVMMMGRGFALAGVSFAPALADELPAGAVVAKLEGTSQSLSTELGENSFPTLVVKAGVPVRWTMHATEATLNECNHEMAISALGVQATFKLGDTVIEFTPKAPGELPYTCWMGMINGRILVRDKLPGESP